MTPIIQQALQMGYAADQILNFIGTKIPKMMQNITQAKSQGYSDQDILKFISGKIKVNPEKAKSQLTSMERYLAGSGHKTKEEKQNEKAKFLKSALGVAGTALGAYNYGKQLTSALSQRGQGGPQIGPQPGGTPTPPLPTANGPISPNQPNIGPQNPQNGPSQPVSQPKTPKLTPYQQQQSQMPHDPAKILDDMGLSKSIQKLQDAGNKPEAIKAAIEHQVKPFQRDWLRKQTGLEIGAVVDEYLQNHTPQKNIQSNESRQAPEAENDIGNHNQHTEEITEGITQEKPPILQQKTPPQEITQAKEPTKSQKPLAKGSTVITPEGDFAKVEDLPGKTAKIDVDGKKRVIEADEAIPLPDNEDELLDLYERLIAKLPEEYKSGPLNWVGYDSDRNLMSVKYHNGDQYTFEDIPPEFVERIKNADFLAKTTGNNYFGAWEQGKSSRGAGMHALIQDLQKQYGGKGKEYIAKFKQVYSYFEHPERLLKEKQAKQKQAAKEAKDREREEKKKRKGTT